MAFHIVLPRRMSSQEMEALEPGGDRPRMGIAMLAKELGAKLHVPKEESPVSGLDAIRARLAGPQSLWSLARAVALNVKPGDVIFCGTEAGGLQVGEVCGGRKKGAKICMFVHNLDRPRGRLALKLFGIRRKVSLLLACSNLQTTFLQKFLNLPNRQIQFIWDHTDTTFFSPGPMSPGKKRPLIVSVGLEQRDYRTLAAATQDLDVDVKISGFSEDAAVLQRTFPSEMPANMTRKFYEWRELVQLYRDADVVVVSVHENKYAAGVQSLMEGMACGRPIIATATAGLKSYLDPNIVVSVRPADVSGMREAIVQTLLNSTEADVRAKKGTELARTRHGIERYVQEIADHLRTLQCNSSNLPTHQPR